MTTDVSNVEALLAQCWDTMLTQPAEAAELALQAQGMSEPSSDIHCKSLCYLGLCLIYDGKFEPALDVLNQALAICLEFDQIANTRQVNNALGMCYQALGRYGAAFDYFEFTAEIARKMGDEQLLVPPLINMASLMYEMGDLEGSEQILTDLLGMNLKGVSEDNLVEIYLLQTQILVSSLLFSEAEVALEQTEQLASNIGFNNAILRLKTQQGRYYRLQGKLDEAVKLFESVLVDINLPLASTEVLEVYVELAKALYSLQKPEDAIGYLNEGLKQVTPPDHSPVFVSVLEQLAHGHHVLGQFKEEAVYLLKIQNIERSSSALQTQNILQLRDIKRKQQQDQLNKQLVDRENILLKNSQTRLNLINEIAHQITMTLDFKQLGQQLFSILEQEMDVHFISLLTVDEQSEMLNFRFVIESGELEEGEDFSLNDQDTHSAQAITQRQPVLIRNAGKLSEFSRVGSGKLTPRSMLFVPLILEEEVLGVFSLQSPLADRFSDQEVKMLVAISKFIAVAVSNILALERVKLLNESLIREKLAIEEAQERIAHMAYHDSLTTLPNRQALEEIVEQRLSRPNQIFHLVFIDLDGFKPVNDRYGHRVGDQVLVQISERLKASLRSKDYAFRVGGDEFVLVIDDFSTDANFKNFLQRLLGVIEQPLLIDDIQVQLSASIGSAQYPVKGTNLDALMHKADSAMYEIKRSGKGGVKTC